MRDLSSFTPKERLIDMSTDAIRERVERGYHEDATLDLPPDQEFKDIQYLLQVIDGLRSWAKIRNTQITIEA